MNITLVFEYLVSAITLIAIYPIHIEFMRTYLSKCNASLFSAEKRLHFFLGSTVLPFLSK